MTILYGKYFGSMYQKYFFHFPGLQAVNVRQYPNPTTTRRRVHTVLTHFDPYGHAMPKGLRILTSSS